MVRTPTVSFFSPRNRLGFSSTVRPQLRDELDELHREWFDFRAREGGGSLWGGLARTHSLVHRLKLTTACAPPKRALLGRAPRHNFPTLTFHGMYQQPVSPLTCTNRIHHRSRRVPVSFSWNFELTPSSGTPHDEGRPRPRLPYATRCTGTLAYRFLSSITVLTEPRVVVHLAGAPYGTFRCHYS